MDETFHIATFRNSRPKLEFGFGNDQELTTTVTCPAQDDDALNVEVLSKVFTDEYVHLQAIEQRQPVQGMDARVPVPGIRQSMREISKRA